MGIKNIFFIRKSVSILLLFCFIISFIPRDALAVSVPGIPSGASSGGVMTPYGGQSIFTLPCTCSGGFLYVLHDYATKLILPLYQDATTIYHTPQNVAALLSPGHYQIGHYSGNGECVIGVPPFCFIKLSALKIYNFGNGGVPVDGAPINPLAWVALATAIAAGTQIIFAEGDDGTAEGSPGCNAELTDVYFCGDADGPMTAYFETPGRTSWPQKSDGGGPIEYKYSWSGAVSGTGQTKTTSFSTPGLRNVSVTVADPKKTKLKRDCPPVIVAEQAPVIDPNSKNLNVSCTVSKTVVNKDERVTFSLEAFGGSGEYEYKWNGDVKSATTTYATSSSSLISMINGNNSITTSFTNPGTKVVSVTLGDKISGKTATRYCAPVVVKNDTESLMCGANYLNVTCSVDKRSVNPGETVTYTATGSGGTPEPSVIVNGLIYLNGKKVDWLKVCQNSKNLVNMFEGYGEWNSSNIPEAGDMVEVSIRSIDGRYELKGEAEWPDGGCGPHGGQTYDSCSGSGAPTDGGLSCPGSSVIPPVAPVPCPDTSGMLSYTSGLSPVSTSQMSGYEFIEKSGVISMEAENFISQVGYVTYANPQASEGKVIQVGGGGTVNYEFKVTTPGNWYVWIRTYVLDSNNNGMHLMLNSSNVTNQNGINDIYLKKGGWSWEPEWLFGESDHEGPITINLNSGKNTLSILKRKIERPQIDKIVLTRTNQPPTGFGPAETKQAVIINNPNPLPDPEPDPGNSTETDFASVTGQKASFLFDDADTRVMNILSPKMSNSEFQQIVARTKANGDNSIYLFLINEGDGPYTPETFYVNDQIGGEIDATKLSLYKQRLNYLKSLDYKIIFWLRADDSASMMRQSINNYKKYHQDVVDNFGSYASGYVIGLESNEYMDASTEKTLIADMKTRTNKTVGVHYGSSDSYNSRAKASGADVYYRQYGWVSCSKVASMTTSTISAVSPMKVIAAEYDRDSDSGCGAWAVQAGAIGYGNG